MAGGAYSGAPYPVLPKTFSTVVDSMRNSTDSRPSPGPSSTERKPCQSPAPGTDHTLHASEPWTPSSRETQPAAASCDSKSALPMLVLADTSELKWYGELP